MLLHTLVFNIHPITGLLWQSDMTAVCFFSLRNFISSESFSSEIFSCICFGKIIYICSGICRLSLVYFFEKLYFLWYTSFRIKFPMVYNFLLFVIDWQNGRKSKFYNQDAMKPYKHLDLIYGNFMMMVIMDIWDKMVMGIIS